MDWENRRGCGREGGNWGNIHIKRVDEGKGEGGEVAGEVEGR